MGITLSSCCFERRLSDTQKEERLCNRYHYLKCTFDHYLLYTSKNKVKLIHGHGIKSLGEEGFTLKTIGELIQLLCYVPEQYPCLCYPFSNIFQDYELECKQGVLKVRHQQKGSQKNKYSTYDMLSWHDYAWQNHFFYKPDEKSFFAIPFMTACAVLEIMNLEYKLFANKDCKRQDFQTFLEECNSIDIPMDLLNKLLTWTTVHHDHLMMKCLQHLSGGASSFSAEQCKKQLQLVNSLKEVLTVVES